MKAQTQLPCTRNKALVILFCHAGIFLMIILSGLVVPALHPIDQADLYPASIQLTCLSAWMLWSWYAVKGSLFDPYSLFMYSAILFNGGQALLEFLHMNEHGILDGRFPPELLVQAIYLATLGLAALHLGTMCSLIFGLRSRRSLAAIAEDREKLRLLGFSIIAIAIVPAAITFVSSIQAVVAYGYFVGIFQAHHSAGFAALPALLTNFLVPGALFLLAGSRNKLSGRIISFLVVVLFGVTNIFLGIRSSGVMALLAYAWLWHRCVRPLPKTLLLIATGILFFVLLPVVSVVRSTGGGERLSSDAWVHAFTSLDNPAIAIVSEMGGTLAILAYTIELVPSVRPFDLGRSYGYAFFSVIPNVGWSIHPSVAHGLLGDWLIRTVDPTTAAAGGGIGFSFIAEAYLNFGWLGAPIALVSIGFLMGKLFLWADVSGSVAKNAAVATFLSLVLLFSRGESAFLIRGLIWYSLGPYLLVKLFERGKRIRRRPQHTIIHAGVQPQESRIY